MPDEHATAKRLLKNQTDLGDAIKPFYGAAAGDKLTALLKDHILVAVDIIDAGMKGDTAKRTRPPNAGLPMATTSRPS